MIGCRFTNDINASPFLAPQPLPRRGVPARWQVAGGVASPGLRGGQVAVLRLHVASAGHVTRSPYSCLRRMHMRQGTKEALNFGELCQYEVRHGPGSAPA